MNEIETINKEGLGDFIGTHEYDEKWYEEIAEMTTSIRNNW